MNKTGNGYLKKDQFDNPEILLTILPYWDPMVAPMGITSLKRFLQSHGYQVKTVDMIVTEECLEFYNNYFDTFRECIPEEKWGNFNNFGHDVLQNHLMAHQNYIDEKEYIELVKTLIYKTFYVEVDQRYILKLNRIMDIFYARFKTHFLQLLEEEKPDVLGVTAYKGTIPVSMFALKLARENYPHIKTLMGGGAFSETHAPGSPNFQALLETTKGYLDKIILGPGELLTLKYLRGELPEDQRVYSKADIDGRILAFEEMDIPDFSDLDINKYPYLAATASAGCIYQCSFCVAAAVAGKYRTKDPAQTVAEMKKMAENSGHQLFFMTDALLNPVVTDLAKEVIKTGASVYYDSFFKVDEASADIRNTLLWRQGGLYRVRLGTESGSQRVLDAIDKKITVKQIKATVSALAYAGIKTTTYWVIGHPGETEEDFQQTLDLVEELKDDIFQSECNYFLVHYNQQNQANNWRQDLVSLYPENALDKLIYYTYILNVQPSREVTFERIHRFEAHCKKLGIPNPYSYQEYAAADERWKRLHKNAVPPMLDFLTRHKYIDENQYVRVRTYARNERREQGDFGF